MKLSTIVLKLRLGNTRFKENIAGSAELAIAMKNTLMKEAAFIIPLSETCNKNDYDSGINQKVVEKFGVVVAIQNDLNKLDKTGITAYDLLHDIRAQIFKSILGWQIGDGEESIVSFGGGTLLDINPAWLWYQYEFYIDTRLDQDDCVDAGYTDEFESLYTQVETWPTFNLETPYTGTLPVTAWGPDMTTLVTTADDPYDGPFGRAFDNDYDWYPKNDPWK